MKTLRRLLQLFIFTIILSTALPLSSSAAGSSKQTVQIITSDERQDDQPHLRRSSLGSVESGYYYKTLNSQGKKIYKKLLKNKNSTKRVTVKLSKPVRITESRAAFRAGKHWDNKKLTALDLVFLRTAHALLDSNPDFYWLHTYGWTYSARCVIYKTKVVVTVDRLTFRPVQVYKNAKKDFSAVKKKANSIATSILQSRPDTSRYTTARLIYEYLAATVSYSYGYSSSSSPIFAPASALLDKYGHLSVCDGYSRAFKMLCDRCKVPCLYIPSDKYEHAWNMVQLENGVWYGVDVTWGDSNDRYLSYEWFMYGRDTAQRYGHPINADFIFHNRAYGIKIPSLAATGILYEAS